MKNYCIICEYLFDVYNRNIVAICIERNEPVCSFHAIGCIEDGHGTRPLPVELTKEVSK